MCKLLVKKLDTVCQSGEKPLLFEFDLLLYGLLFLVQIGVVPAHQFAYFIHEAIHKGLFDAEQIAMANGAAQNSTQNISPALAIKICSLR